MKFESYLPYNQYEEKVIELALNWERETYFYRKS